MNDGRIKLYRVQCGRCLPREVLPIIFTTITRRSAIKLALEHATRTGHKTPRIIGRYIRPVSSEVK